MTEQMSLAGEASLRFAPWSISKAEIAETCPKQFQYKYVLKSKAEVVPTANKVGVAAHRVLELRLAGKSADVAWRTALEEHPLVDSEEEELRSMLDAIEAFLRKFQTFCQQNRVVDVLLEQKWGITNTGARTGFKDADVFFRGVLDLGAVTQAGDLIVIDHKSGFAKDIKKELKYRRQVDSYHVMALANLERFAGSRGAIHFLQGAEDKRIQWMDYVPAAKIREMLIPWLFSYIEYCAKKAVEPFIAKPKMKWPCSWCSYSPSCTSYQELARGSKV